MEHSRMSRSRPLGYPQLGANELPRNTPSDYTTATRYPLVVVLHARGSSAAETAIYLGATQRIEARQFVLVTPDGTEDTEGRLAWDAGAESGLWAVQQAPHVPDFTDDARDLWFDWLFAR
jgi:poly(3-hydroxybutyrate) depolymerase